MNHYPMSKSARVAARRQIRDAAQAQARRLELTRGRSMKCGGYDGRQAPEHAGDFDGCKNDGTTCVCECHDPSGADT